ncbi:hypothetical protein GCM10022294_16060 [Dietzia aurantiaca]
MQPAATNDTTAAEAATKCPRRLREQKVRGNNRAGMTSNLTHTYSPVQAYIIFSLRERIRSLRGAISQYAQLKRSGAAIASFTTQDKPVDLPRLRLDHGEYQLM